MEDNYEAMGLTNADRDDIGQQELVDQQANQLMENPFEGNAENAQGSDEPMQYAAGMAEILLNNDAIPPIFRKKWWFVVNNDNVLTFLDEESKAAKLMSFDITVIDQLNSMESYYDYTFKTELQNGLMRNVLDTKLDRAKGTTSTNKNERSMMQSQFTESKNINEVGQSGGTIKEGFFKRLLGRR